MNISQRKLILSIIFFGIILPFVTTILFLRSEYIFYVIIFNILCLVFLVISYCIYIVKETNIKYRTMILIIVPLLITLYLTNHFNILKLSNKTNFIIISKNKYVSLLNDVKDYNFEKIIVLRNHQHIWVNNFEYGNDSIRSHLKIPPEILEIIIDKMESAGIYRINKYEGIIYFTNGGFIDSESGYAYSENNTKPERNHTGKVYTWQKVENNWYYWYAD